MSGALKMEASIDRGAKTCILDGTRLQVDPEADVADLFQNFNRQFFWNKLEYVEVRWSPRMTLCAGLCVYHRRPGYCSVRLSRPLLSLRGKLDLVETLLHEMIHAYLFVTENDRDRDGHGPQFLKHMDRINREAGLNISVYHTFRDEVRHYQQHVWICDGPCQLRSPYFGKVHRSINRDPGPTDQWWSDHQRDCGGSFSKIAEPEGYKPQKKKAPSQKKGTSVCKTKDIRLFFKPMDQKVKNTSSNKSLLGSNSTSGQLSEKCEEESPNDKSQIGIATKDTERNMSAGNSNFSPANEVIEISSDESDSENSESEDSSDYSNNDEGLFGIFGSIFNMPFRYSKRCADDPDQKSIKVRKPNLNAIPKSKRGVLKNLIKIPDQPTLDTFYKKRSLASFKKSQPTGSGLEQGQKKLKQATVQSFFNKRISDAKM